jgi:phage/plasmid-like protein (TIGR03299 family)
MAGKTLAPSGFQPNLRVIPGTNGGGDVAEYIQPERSGLDSGFYTTPRGLPWHVTLSRRLNTPELMKGSDAKLTTAEAIELAGLDWEVEMVPLYAKVGKGYTPALGKLASVRKDTGAVLGIGRSERFQLVQNRAAFAFGDMLLDEGGANCETAGSLFGGRAVFVSFELPDSIVVDGDDSEYVLFLLISNGHDGKHPFRADITIERAVCRNTVRIAQKGAINSFALRHTSKLEGRIAQARKALGLSFRYAESFSGTASAMVGKSLVDRQVDDLLTTLFPVTERQQAALDAGKEPVTVKSKVLSVYQESPTVLRGTAYGVLNAVSEYVDHAVAYRDGASGDARDNRAEALMFNDSRGEVKQRTWDALVELVK